MQEYKFSQCELLSVCIFLFLSSCSFFDSNKHIRPAVITIIGTFQFIIVRLKLECDDNMEVNKADQPPDDVSDYICKETMEMNQMMTS